jgi:signal transduction histidine kinase
MPLSRVWRAFGRRRRDGRADGPSGELQAARDRYLIRLVNARETEARRISHVLHDDVVQQLTALQLRIELAGYKHDLPELAALAGSASAVIASIRQLLVELHPAILESQGLGPAADVVAESLRERGLDVRVTAFPHRLSPETELLAYRIVQEALTNVTVHADAARAEVDLRLADGVLRGRVSDDGNGFDADAVLASGEPGIGMYVARERVELAGGRFLVRSSTGSGTDIVFELPVEAPDVPAEAAS